MERKQVDWEAVEREYRAGQLSVREIARQYDVTEGAVRKKAKAGDWTRNLDEQVRQKVRDDLVRKEVRTADPREAIDVAAARGVEVVRQHRRSLGKLHGMAVTMADIAQARIDHALGNLPDDDPLVVAAALLISDRESVSDVIEKAGRTVQRLVPLERQAFNLDEKGGGADSFALNINLAGD